MSELDADDGKSIAIYPRAYHRILKLTQTIADLAGSQDIQSTHLAEALYLRSSEIDNVIAANY